VYAENAVGEGSQNFYEIMMPGREWMAVLVTVNE
jgi:hypothetical protein